MLKVSVKVDRFLFSLYSLTILFLSRSSLSNTSNSFIALVTLLIHCNNFDSFNRIRDCHSQLDGLLFIYY
jgi:hypothetical protein